MRRGCDRFFVVLAACLVVIPIALAQAPEAPKPGPEHEKLGYFVGKWTSEGEMKETPFGPGGKMTSSDDCRWFDGKFAVVCHASGTSPAGPVKSIGIMSYSVDEKAYTYYGLESTGMVMTTVPLGTITGDTWTYADESKMGGKTVKSRYVLKVLSPTSYTWTWDLLGEDGNWSNVAKGKSVKQ